MANLTTRFHIVTKSGGGKLFFNVLNVLVDSQAKFFNKIFF